LNALKLIQDIRGQAQKVRSIDQKIGFGLVELLSNLTNREFGKKSIFLLDKSDLTNCEFGKKGDLTNHDLADFHHTQLKG